MEGRTVTEILISALMVVGAFFMFVAGLGILRMPDLFMRMSSSTKAGTIGLGTLLLSLAFYFLDFGVAARAIATIGFIFLTAPVSSHRIGRIAYLVGVPLWHRTRKDEMQGVYPPDACVKFGEECIIPDMNAPD
jgi:multicomponent Na+:H+ antiporter subunit G